jgi:hypothetical protein
MIIKSVEAEIKNLDECYPNCSQRHIYELNKEKLFLIIETVWKIQQNGKIGQDDIRVLTEGLGENWEVIFYNHVGKYLSQLEPEYKEIEELVMQAANSRKWMLRRNAAIISELFENKNLTRKILKFAINDKSMKVFEMAFDRIMGKHTNDQELQKLVVERVNKIKDSERKENFLRDIDLHKNGYFINPSENGRRLIMFVKNSNGIMMSYITDEEFENIEDIEKYINNRKMEEKGNRRLVSTELTPHRLGRNPNRTSKTICTMGVGSIHNL